MAAVMIPPALRRNVVGNWGAVGERWLADLPGLIDEVAREWDLTMAWRAEPFPLSLNWVAPATRGDGTPVVVKLGVPDGHLDHEATALLAYAGSGAIRLLASAPGALLLERVEPGVMAADLVPSEDAAATDALIRVGRRLHRPVPAGVELPHLRKEAESFRKYLRRFPSDGPLPRHLVTRAAGLFDELCLSTPEDRLLHGDLHHDNVLRATREPWLAIDPFGLVGDPGFDCGPMLYNPNPLDRDPALLALVPARLEQLADGYRLPLDRVMAWGFVMGVLSEVWNTDGDVAVGTRALDVAELLYPRLP
jgi:streptomycin 6-kinase